MPDSALRPLSDIGYATSSAGWIPYSAGPGVVPSLSSALAYSNSVLGTTRASLAPANADLNSILDFTTQNPTTTPFLMRFLSPNYTSGWNPASYVKGDGSWQSNAYAVWGQPNGQSGSSYAINPPTADPLMVGIFADVQYAFISRSSSTYPALTTFVSPDGRYVGYVDGNATINWGSVFTNAGNAHNANGQPATDVSLGRIDQGTLNAAPRLLVNYTGGTPSCAFAAMGDNVPNNIAIFYDHVGNGVFGIDPIGQTFLTSKPSTSGTTSYNSPAIYWGSSRWTGSANAYEHFGAYVVRYNNNANANAFWLTDNNDAAVFAISGSGGQVAIGNSFPSAANLASGGQLQAQSIAATTPAFVARGYTSQTADIIGVQDVNGNPLAGFRSNGAPYWPTLADTAAANNSNFIASDHGSVPAWKNAAGAVYLYNLTLA